MIGIGFAELLCLGVFFFLILGVLGLFLLLQIKRHGSAGPSPAVSGLRRPKAPNRRPTTYTPLGSEASVALVARIAERFCPSCRASLDRDAPEGLCPACLMAGGIASEFAAAPADGFAATTPAGGRPESADHDIAGLQNKFPQLEVLELLGRGGMGSVYKVRQRNLDRVVALKVIPPESARDPEFAERFAREARALARLNHPNIVTVYDFGQSGDVYYLLMEYVDGVNLRHTLRAGRLQPEEALAVVPQICDALQYAHDQGVVHRDIKPENVLLDRSGRIKIADFGLAKLLGLAAEDFNLTRTQQVMGTPRYMAPEQIDRPSKVDHRADIYSLGVVIYEMLTGELPVGRFALPSEKAEIDPRIDRVVLRSLEREPDQRYQRASQVKSALTEASAGMAFPAPSAADDDWSGPRFPTPVAVYIEPKPPTYDTTTAAPLAYPLMVALGMVIGCLMITAGLVMLAAALFEFDPGSRQFGGWFSAAIGFICGGGGLIVGSYNSYRQLPGAEDLLRAPRTTWFDWILRGYLVLGCLLAAASFIALSQSLFIVGSVMLGQATLFAVVRSLFSQHEVDSRYASGSGSQISPTLWRAAGIPTLALAAIWFAVVVDVLYATPIIAPDERGSQWLSYLFYQHWQVANWALGIGLIPLCFGVLASCRALRRRTMAGELPTVEYPFEHPGWLLAVTLLGLSAVVLPWARLERASEQTVSLEVGRSGGLDFSGIDMSAIAGLPGGFRYASREVVGKRIGLAILFTVPLGAFALLPLPARVRSLATLGLGLAMLALTVTVLHEMADRPAKFILDQRTVGGIERFLEKLGGGYVDPSQWGAPLSEVIAVRPAIGLFALLGSGILATFLGLSGLSWASGVAETTERAGVLPRQKVPFQPIATERPALQARERALAQVRGPAAGLFVAGFLGLLITAAMLLLSIALVPSSTVVVKSTTLSSATTSPLRMAATAISWSNPAGAAVPASLFMPQKMGHPFQFAQAMSPADAARFSAAEAHSNWMAIAMPAILFALLSMPISILLVVGALRMWKLESYHFSVGVALLACVPCTPAWLIGLPMGLWAISVLLRPEVKAAFDQPML